MNKLILIIIIMPLTFSPDVERKPSPSTKSSSPLPLPSMIGIDDIDRPEGPGLPGGPGGPGAPITESPRSPYGQQRNSSLAITNYYISTELRITSRVLLFICSSERTVWHVKDCMTKCTLLCLKMIVNNLIGC